MIDIKVVTFSVIFGGLAGAIIWDLITWYTAFRPARRTRSWAGTPAPPWPRRASRDCRRRLDQDDHFHFLSPLIGLTAGCSDGVHPLDLPVDAPSRVDQWFRRLQLAPRRSSASITARTTRRRRWASSPACCTPQATSRRSTFLLVVLIAHTAIGLGTLAGGGASSTRWLQDHEAAARRRLRAETGAAIALLIATQTGVPVSTTHAITGAIVA